MARIKGQRGSHSVHQPCRLWSSPMPSPSGTRVTHKGLIQVCHLLLELWGPDVGVGHAHHDHTPREGGGAQDNGMWGPQGPEQRARSSPTSSTASSISPTALKLCSVVLPLPPHPIPTTWKGVFWLRDLIEAKESSPDKIKVCLIFHLISKGHI